MFALILVVFGLMSCGSATQSKGSYTQQENTRALSISCHLAVLWNYGKCVARAPRHDDVSQLDAYADHMENCKVVSNAAKQVCNRMYLGFSFDGDVETSTAQDIENGIPLEPIFNDQDNGM